MQVEFGSCEVAVVDLDAAKGKGSNKEVILDLLKLGRCRVGGGIRDFETAMFWLDAGAAKIVIGTAATPELLKQLPRERVVAALDAVRGEVRGARLEDTTEAFRGRRLLDA